MYSFEEKEGKSCLERVQSERDLICCHQRVLIGPRGAAYMERICPPRYEPAPARGQRDPEPISGRAGLAMWRGRAAQGDVSDGELLVNLLGA